VSQIWSWALDAGGLICTYLVGRKFWWGWLVWQAINLTWFVYAIVTRQWGFLPGCLIYAGLNHHNMTRWKNGID